MGTCFCVGVFGEAGSRTRLLNILVQLRKCVNHPYLFDGQPPLVATQYVVNVHVWFLGVEPEPFELGDHLILSSG